MILFNYGAWKDCNTNIPMIGFGFVLSDLETFSWGFFFIAMVYEPSRTHLDYSNGYRTSHQHQGMSTEIKCECLDILCDVLHKYGNLMDTDHESLLTSLLPQLSSNQASFRKKSISCIDVLLAIDLVLTSERQFHC